MHELFGCFRCRAAPFVPHSANLDVLIAYPKNVYMNLLGVHTELYVFLHTYERF